MGKRTAKRDNRREAERLCAELDVDLITLATFVRRQERRGIDLRPVSNEALEALQEVAERVAAARAIFDEQAGSREGSSASSGGLLPHRATMLGAPARLD